jgi:predicted CopG family antitoxin
MEKFIQEVAEKHEGMRHLVNPEGEISMSDAISQLIEPYRQDAPDIQSFRSLVTFACVAWNATIMPKEKRDEMLHEILAELPAQSDERTYVRDFLKELMKRKQKLFPHVTRMIMEYKVTDLGNDFHIAIASTLGK